MKLECSCRRSFRLPRSFPISLKLAGSTERPVSYLNNPCQFSAHRHSLVQFCPVKVKVVGTPLPPCAANRASHIERNIPIALHATVTKVSTPGKDLALYLVQCYSSVRRLIWNPAVGIREGIKSREPASCFLWFVLWSDQSQPPSDDLRSVRAAFGTSQILARDGQIQDSLPTRTLFGGRGAVRRSSSSVRRNDPKQAARRASPSFVPNVCAGGDAQMS